MGVDGTRTRKQAQRAPPTFPSCTCKMADQADAVTEGGLSTEQVARENKELRSRCQFLESDLQRHKHLAFEWQSFGKYTAQVLKDEMESASKKIKYLESRVEELNKENKELKDMCLYLDQSGTGESTLTPPEITELLAQTKFLSKLNLQGKVPHLSGPQQTSVSGQADLTEAVTELGRRVERLEREKLELVKSLSAAHLLGANTQTPSNGHYRGLSTPCVVEHPPKLDTVLQRGGQEEVDSGNSTARSTSPETIVNAVMLLDLIQRLEAAEVTGVTDPVGQAEVETLKVLIAIAWQKIQEQISTNDNKTNTN